MKEQKPSADEPKAVKMKQRERRKKYTKSRDKKSKIIFR